MDRVDYHLERLLPSLQLLTHLSLFTPLELQSITQQRRNHELHLISRGVSLPHYLEYIALEESFEKLTQLRVGRAGKDERGNDVVSLKDRNKLRRFQERQLLSVWQRMVTKLGPRDPDVFLRYLTWLQGRKMRRIYSQIAAQALSLHPSHVDLWIHVADWELNANLDASAARLTLLRAIRLNTHSSGAAKRRAAVKAKEGRRRKRQRAEMEGEEESDEENESDGESEDTGVEEEEAPQPSTSSAAATLNIPAALTPSSRDLLALWLAYLRMECVFLERLRRRWALLGITGGADATQAIAEEGGRKSDDEGEEGDDDDEGIADGAVSNGKSLNDAREDAAASAANESAKATAPTKILSGALPLAIISSALSANPASSTPSPSLPQDLKLLFTLVVLRLLLSFPFETREKADGEELRNRLVESVLTTFDATCGGNSSSLVRRVTETTASTRFAAYRRLVAEDEESRPQEDVDRRRNDELRAAAKLVVHSQRGQDEVSAMVDIGAEPEEDEGESETSPKSADRAVRALLAQVVEDIRRTQTYAQATAHRETAGKIKVGLANAIKALLHHNDSSNNLPRVKLAKAVWKSLAYQHQEEDEEEEEEEGGAELRPTQDPLLPYVSALLERALRKQNNPQALLLFRRLALQHETDLFSPLEEADENAASALAQKWKDLDDQAAQTLASQPYPRSLVWTSRWAFEQAQRAAAEAEGERNIPGQLEKANDFWLAQLRSLDPEKKKRNASMSTSTSASATCRFITTLLLPWARTEHEEGRGIYVDVVERAVTLSRRLLLVARAESGEAREEMQRCHDEALLCLFTLLGKEEATMELWQDGKKASPSLGAWMKLLPLLQGKATLLSAAQHVERLALQLSLRPPMSGDDVETAKSSSLLLDVFTALFETYLVKLRDVQAGVGLLQKAKRCAGGGEEWGRRVEGRWEEVSRRAG